VHSGVVDTAMVGLYGLVGQMQREEGVKKIRRGLAGVVRDGRISGSLAYGYRVLAQFDARGNPVRGLREIDEAQAEVVRRIFAEYADGHSPRDIAGGLNRDRIPAPKARHWNASTINGFGKRKSGLLLNETYRGRFVWNRTRKMRNPDTGRRVSRPNDPDACQVAHLRIVDDELWNAVQEARGTRTKNRLSTTRRPPHLLSGLIFCAECGGGITVKDRDKTGKTRIRCSTSASRGRARTAAFST
jgi:site-specific DNA recombinase